MVTSGTFATITAASSPSPLHDTELYPARLPNSVDFGLGADQLDNQPSAPSFPPFPSQRSPGFTDQGPPIPCQSLPQITQNVNHFTSQTVYPNHQANSDVTRPSRMESNLSNTLLPQIPPPRCSS